MLLSLLQTFQLPSPRRGSGLSALDSKALMTLGGEQPFPDSACLASESQSVGSLRKDAARLSMWKGRRAGLGRKGAFLCKRVREGIGRTLPRLGRGRDFCGFHVHSRGKKVLRCRVPASEKHLSSMLGLEAWELTALK